jgi:hypothetical protein
MTHALPLFAHRLDLAEGYEAADRLGRLFVAGKLEWADVCHYVRHWARLAHKLTGVDASGAEARLAWAASEAVAAAERERSEAERAIKNVLRPLIEARVPKAGLLSGANQSNADHGALLTGDEVEAVVRTEVDWLLRRSRRDAG